MVDRVNGVASDRADRQLVAATQTLRESVVACFSLTAKMITIKTLSPISDHLTALLSSLPLVLCLR